MKDKKVRPAVLIIMDGWGINPTLEHNAILSANTPVWDRLWKEYPHTEIKTSGPAVGLPSGQMGNSEVGHMNIGSGRVVYQEFTRISRSIRTGSFFNNRTLTDAVDLAIEKDSALHILGLLSPGGVHSHEDHIHALVKLACERGLKKVYIHAFLDGRDMPPKSALASIEKMLSVIDELGVGQVISLIGRYYAMDRDNRWERNQESYDLLTSAISEYVAVDPLMGLATAYERGETDEFVRATSIVPKGTEAIHIEDNDIVISMNYRSDRARQLTRPFIEEGFDGFERKAVRKLAGFISLTEYNKSFDMPVAFPSESLKNVLGEYISNLGLRQLRLAETEKYPHVTFFFNGGLDDPFEGEDRILVPSPHVATYDLKPEMSAHEVTDHLIEALEGDRYDTIIVNFANGDMVGHTGNFEAAVEAIETLDHCLSRIIKALHKTEGELLITADHGNAEQMLDTVSGQAFTAHTCNVVPLIYVGERKASLGDGGALCDIAPTLLKIMGVPQPEEMTGQNLLDFEDAE